MTILSLRDELDRLATVVEHEHAEVAAERLQERRIESRETETVRRLEVRGGPLQQAHFELARVESTLERAKDEAKLIDERRDIQRAIDSLTEAKHWLARAIRSDLDANRRTKVKHAQAA